MKSQLVISHCFLLIKQIATPGRRRKNQVTFLEYPRYFLDIPSIFISKGTLRVQKTLAQCLARRCDQGERR
jgi:hypothetical protein